jgi:hypothetical protein
VIRKRWIKVRWLLGSMATMTPCAAGAQSLSNSDAPSTLPSQASAPDDPWTILQSPDISQEARDMAAIRLVAGRDPSARPVVVDLLTNGSTPTKVAISRALASVGWAEEDFIDPLMSLLRGQDPVPAAAAALALGSYNNNPQVLQELIVQAKSDRSDIRQPVIRALGAFAEKPAAETLLGLLHDESDPIRESAGNALIEMTGRSDLDHDSARQLSAAGAKRSSPWSPGIWPCKTPPMIFFGRISGIPLRKSGRGFCSHICNLPPRKSARWGPNWSIPARRPPARPRARSSKPACFWAIPPRKFAPPPQPRCPPMSTPPATWSPN